MIVGPQGTGANPYTEWKEKSGDGSNTTQVDTAIWENFNALNDDIKTDIYNLLRFPKSNIKMCAELLSVLKNRSNRWPGISQGDFTAERLAMEIIATEFNVGAVDSLKPTSLGADNEAVPNTWGLLTVSMRGLAPLALTFPDSLQDGADAYGGYDLRQGDNDESRLWAGQDPVDGANPPAANHVEQLQQDLIELGFKIVGVADGDFGAKTEWAVREFQIYAKMRFIALQTPDDNLEYVDQLSQALNLLYYTGPISGFANIGTRIAIEHWKKKNWRCPVVITARTADGHAA
jgi:hypothetical protein